MDLRKCIRVAIRDKDCCRELANTLMEDIKEMSSVHESELATRRVELNRRGQGFLGTEVDCVLLRSRVASLEDELADLTQWFANLDHTWVEERTSLEAGRANGLALELVLAKAYIHSTLSMEYR